MIEHDFFPSADSAVLSPCGRYRYRLDREIQPEGIVIAYFGINVPESVSAAP